jgi:hypothetical protein
MVDDVRPAWETRDVPSHYGPMPKLKMTRVVTGIVPL